MHNDQLRDALAMRIESLISLQETIKKALKITLIGALVASPLVAASPLAFAIVLSVLVSLLFAMGIAEVMIDWRAQ